MEIPETRQAAALAEVARLGGERARLLKQADDLLDPLREATVKAVREGAGRTRARNLAGVSPKVFYAWLKAAGIPVSEPKSRGTPRQRDQHTE